MKLEHERALFLEGRASSGPRASAILADAAKVPYRTYGLLLRATLFVLTVIGVLGLAFFLDQIDVPREGVPAGLICLVLAELLIGKFRWFWTGVEEALWIGGVYCLLSELPSSGQPEAMLVMGAGAAVAGARVRNPLFGALAAGFVAAYFEKRFDLGVVAALVIGLGAAFALLRTWRRPSNEFLWIVIAVLLPLFGYSQADAQWRNATIALFLAYGLVTLFLALRYRHHALFLAAAAGIGVASYEIGKALDVIALEARFALGGALLLGGSWLASRALHNRTHGLVATPAQLTPFDDDFEVIAATAAAASLPRADFDQKAETGGRFGGAGATGEY